MTHAHDGAVERLKRSRRKGAGGRLVESVERSTSAATPAPRSTHADQSPRVGVPTKAAPADVSKIARAFAGTSVQSLRATSPSSCPGSQLE